LDFQEIRAALHPFQVLCHAKRPALADAQRLKQPVAVHETAVVDGDDRLRFGQKTSVEEDEHEIQFLMALQLPDAWQFRE
jgi:hypothetical protein